MVRYGKCLKLSTMERKMNLNESHEAGQSLQSLTLSKVVNVIKSQNSEMLGSHYILNES